MLQETSASVPHKWVPAEKSKVQTRSSPICTNHSQLIKVCQFYIMVSVTVCHTVNLKYFTYHNNVIISHLYPCSCIAKDIKRIKFHFTWFLSITWSEPSCNSTFPQCSHTKWSSWGLWSTFLQEVGNIKTSKISHILVYKHTYKKSPIHYVQYNAKFYLRLEAVHIPEIFIKKLCCFPIAQKSTKINETTMKTEDSRP